MKGWTPNAASYYLPQKHVWKVTGTGQGPAAEHLASVTGRYVIVEASPLKPKDRFDCRNLGFVKESFGWLLIKPPRFWELQKYWWLSNSSFHPNRPPMDDAVLSLDWLSNLALAASEDDWQYLYGSESMDAVHTGLQRRPFARFWLALSRKEKLSALTTGLDRNTLSEVNKKLFLNAVCESLAHCVVQGNVSGLLDPSGEAYLVIRADRHWALLNAYGHSSFRSRSDMLQAIKVGERGRPHQGITFTIEFKSGTGFTRDEAATRFPILDALPIDIDRTGEFE